MNYAGVELKINEESSVQGAFINFVSTMASGGPTELVDFDSVLRYLAVSVALSNLDSYHGALAHNYYSYSQFLQNQNTTVERFYGLTSFMSYRVANMTEQLNGTLPSAGNGSGYCN